jgi:hypothetical protein
MPLYLLMRVYRASSGRTIITMGWHYQAVQTGLITSVGYTVIMQVEVQSSYIMTDLFI